MKQPISSKQNKSKSRSGYSLVTPVGITLLLLLFIFPLTATNAHTLKIATLSPDGTMWMKKMREGGKEIALRTDGRVKLKFYPGGIMGNDASVLRKIRVGQLQGGAVVAGALSKLYPDIQIYTLPFLFESFAEVDYVRSHMDQQLIDGLEKKGFITFGLADGGFGYMMAQSPAITIDQLKAQRIWVLAGDTISQAMFEAAGISPISLPLSDVLTALQTGLINAVAASPIAAIALQWHTKIKYVTDAPLGYVYALLAVDRKAFMKISAPDRRIVHEIMDRVFHEINRQNRIDNDRAIAALRQQGIEFRAPEPRELDQWKAIASTALKKLETQGVYNPETLRTLLAHIDDYRNSRATAGSN